MRSQVLNSLSVERLRALGLLNNESRQIAIWGAAGKGTVLGHSLTQTHDGVQAVDSDPSRWGLFLENSGIPIRSPEIALKQFPQDTLILVCNPNHLNDIERRVDGRFEVSIPSAIE